MTDLNTPRQLPCPHADILPPDAAAAALRKCDLAPHASGNLYLSAMPGRHAPLDTFLGAIEDRKISRILCLTEVHEIRALSPEYLEMIRADVFEGVLDWHPIPDQFPPPERESFDLLLGDLARHLGNRGNVVIHCAAGIGRTGLVATALLITIGFTHRLALERIRQAGAGPESPEQVRFLQEF